jgi:hypothetical protein
MQQAEQDHEHSWQLTERGYIRSWTTEIDEDGTIRAYYGGSEDWSDDGDGYLYLECLQCGIAKGVNNPEKVDWQ